MTRTLEVDLAVEVGVVEDLHGNFILSVIIPLELEVLYFDVLFDIFTGQDDLCIDGGAESGHEHPVSDSQGETHDKDEGPVSVESPSVDDWENALDEPRDTEHDGGELVV